MRQDVSAAISAGGTGLLNLRRGGAGVIHPRAPAAVDESDARGGVADALTDDVLVARARAGDRDAFALLVTRYQDRVHSITRAFVREPDDALDLVQETFVKAFQGLPRFRGGSSFYTWLYRIAVNNCKDFLRRRAVRPSISLEEELLQDAGSEPASHHPHADPAGMAEREELCAVVQAAVAMLPEKLRLAIVLHDIEGVPQREVAEILKCPVGTVKSHVFRGRRQLRKLLGDYVGDKD
ncbi:MAG TPA: sigma-70 family RNA polymerase sigma factor [Armatimonadetes bacterium]|nr:sigma-70 family RNA polymerase sigma factor [Armatimonadota bacterium]